MNNNFDFKKYQYLIHKMGIGDWGLGIGDWGLGIGPIPNPHYSSNYEINFLVN
jgi:hypothetical protein